MLEVNNEKEGDDTLKQDIENLSHEDLVEITQSSVKRLITSDSLLKDLPVDVTTEEVLAQLAVLQGSSITVTIYRHSETPLQVVIPQTGTKVLDLKKAIQRCYTLKQKRSRSKTKISWTYIWKTYSLLNVDTRKVLKDNEKLVTDYGVTNRCVLRFVKRLRKVSTFDNDN